MQDLILQIDSIDKDTNFEQIFFMMALLIGKYSTAQISSLILETSNLIDTENIYNK